MGTTTKWAIPYPAATDPADVPADMQRLADRVDVIANTGTPAPSVTPPASPIEGQLWTYAPQPGVIWMFRYNAASGSAFKWEFAGGSPVHLDAATSQSNGATLNTWQNVSASAFTLVRAGEYLAQAAGTINFPAAAGTAWLTLGLAAAAVGRPARTVQAASGQATIPVPPSMITATAGQALSLMGQANVASVTWLEMGFQALPIRVS